MTHARARSPQTIRKSLDENGEAVHTQVIVDDMEPNSTGQGVDLHEGNIMVSAAGKEPGHVAVAQQAIHCGFREGREYDSTAVQHRRSH